MKMRILSIVVLLMIVALTACKGAKPKPTSAPTATPTRESRPVANVPAEVPGEVIYVPFPVAITVDGSLDDWKGIPEVKVDRGSLLSTIAGEDSAFTFRAAADMSNFYITMQAVDKNIIAGKHGTDFWNEDSLEFYLNTTSNLDATAYETGIFQVNINAADIGNTDPQALTITGVFSTGIKVTGFVFKTPDGWGFEASIPLEGLVTPAHGLEVGFQAQMNGATTQDRDVKLIWSNEDTTDQSWQTPALFGRAIFFELGRTDIPQPSVRAALPTPVPTAGPEVIPPSINVNQVGYFPAGEKIAFVANDSTAPIDWSLLDGSGAEVLKGKTLVKGLDELSGDFLHTIDFSSFSTAGTGYKLKAGELESPAFNIKADLYATLKRDALAYFYLNRSGIALDPQYAGEQWSRPAGHLSDKAVTCFKGTDSVGNTWPGCNYTLNAAGGWYDAGDFGKYVVNGGISAWTLMDLYEQLPAAFADGSQNIPEKANGVPDILDEARWEMEFLLAMQVPEGQPLAGMAHHKMHDESWAPMPMIPPTEVDNDNENVKPGTGRYLYAPSTAATLNLAATAAQCARIWKDIDNHFALRCLDSAEKAWKAALAHPEIYAGNAPGNGGGNYDDNNVTDEFYWAAAELFITTGSQEYQSYLLGSSEFGKVEAFDWGHTAPLGSISLATVKNNLPKDKLDIIKQNFTAYASRMIGVLQKEGYPALIEGDFPWGSNGTMLNNMMLLGVAYHLSNDSNTLNTMRQSMDYLLGANTLNKSFISGYGTYPMRHPHHRFWANDPANGYPPPPPGAVSGGVNFAPSDDAALKAKLAELPAAKRYQDELMAFSTNEVAINWNAPLVWVAAFLDAAGQ